MQLHSVAHTTYAHISIFHQTFPTIIINKTTYKVMHRETGGSYCSRHCHCILILINIRTNDRGFIFAIWMPIATGTLHVLYAQFIAAQRAITNFRCQKDEDMKKKIGFGLFTCFLPCSRIIGINQCRKCAYNLQTTSSQMETEAINISFSVWIVWISFRHPRFPDLNLIRLVPDFVWKTSQKVCYRYALACWGSNMAINSCSWSSNSNLWLI